MSDFKTRLNDEVKDLQDKTSKLMIFISGEPFTKLESIQQTLLTLQLNAMTNYLHILIYRLEAL